MKIIIITQNERNYIPFALDYLIRRLPEYVNLLGCVILEASPFEKKMSFLNKLFKTINVFGIIFLFKYIIRLIIKFINGDTIERVISSNEINKISLSGSINSEKSINILSQLKPDILISITSNEIFKEPLIKVPRLGIINLHSSLLPKHRGLMPSFWTLKNKDEKSGVTVFFVDKGIDSGPIISQKEIKIDGLSQSRFIKMTKILGMETILSTLEKINSNNYELFPNDNSLANYNNFPTRKDVKKFLKNKGKFY